MKIVIIGNGISGVTAARHIRKQRNEEITLISAETPYFFSRTALMYVYMGQLRPEHTQPYEPHFWIKNRINLLQKQVENVDFERKTVQFHDGHNLPYDKLILAVGSTPVKLGWAGEALKGVQGLYSWQDLEALEAHTNQIDTAIVIGGGLIGIELCEMLLSRKKRVIFIVRETKFWRHMVAEAEATLLTNHIVSHGVELYLQEEVAELQGNAQGQVEAVLTKSGKRFDAQFVGVTVGVRPNIDFLKPTALATDKGIWVDEWLQTNLPDVYAVGDCVQHRNPPEGRRAIEQIWYTGRQMGEAVAQTICGKPTPYSPGVFFNSAKFFDIEYQTYGHVPPECPDTHRWLLWQHPTKDLLMRIVYRFDNKSVTGMHTFGIRQRQAVWQQWIEEQQNITTVLQRLEEANFDPEFFRRYETDIRASLLNQLQSHEK